MKILMVYCNSMQESAIPVGVSQDADFEVLVQT